RRFLAVELGELGLDLRAEGDGLVPAAAGMLDEGGGRLVLAFIDVGDVEDRLGRERLEVLRADRIDGVGYGNRSDRLPALEGGDDVGQPVTLGDRVLVERLRLLAHAVEPPGRGLEV